ncbi:acyl carrier protein [Rhodococcus sp. KBW08]|uniref:phosphopantetheine-binding protein n=1 Tax=Rhodococcus sp. KBW08 TaxID=2144188 RepID=UPI000F595CAC|nr:phosphopantetheine-binding protein [Rhodococcus sp. KBW08]RQO51192.1 acyl carrier protein [Rhodococcus sp. KBW08]
MSSNIDSPSAPSLDAVCTVIAQAVRSPGAEPTVVGADTELLLTGLLDSLTVVKIVAELERLVGGELPQSLAVARNFRTPASLHAALTRELTESTR